MFTFCIQAAAALIAAAASGGDPEIANKIIEKMMSGNPLAFLTINGRRGGVDFDL